MIHAFFRGGPLDGESKVLPGLMKTYEVSMPDPTVLFVRFDGPTPMRKGKYERSSEWKAGVVYVWKGWGT